MNVVEKSLNCFIEKKLRMQRFRLFVILRDHQLFSMIDRWMALVLDHGVREMLLNVNVHSGGLFRYDHFYPLPGTAFVTVSSKFYSLQKLKMDGIIISENIMRNIVRNCPNLEYFFLWGFRGLKTLEISKLDKLAIVIIGVRSNGGGELERVYIDAPNLKKFSLKTYYARELPRNINLTGINLTSCHLLKTLHLSKCGITDDSFHSHLSRFSLLEDLEISDCRMLRRIKISVQRLKGLRLGGCEKIEMIEIDAPILSSFRYKACNMPVLFSKNIPCPMEISYSMHTRGRQVISSWFLDLRKFLGASPQRKHFKLMHNESEVSFDLEELEEVEISPVFQVDYLELVSYSLKEDLDCGSLIDGLLWSCHPKTIFVPSDSVFLINCIKVLCEKLLDKEQPECCTSSRVKCWRHELRGAKIEMFRGIKDVQVLDFPHLLESLSSLTEDHQVHFKLEWNF
ncbi:uncharacterized protein LOC21391490 [Morus notabilis]|nr:uncharacterized protein LOC21391490 [Morus notabilis]